MSTGHHQKTKIQAQSETKSQRLSSLHLEHPSGDGDGRAERCPHAEETTSIITEPRKFPSDPCFRTLIRNPKFKRLVNGC